MLKYWLSFLGSMKTEFGFKQLTGCEEGWKRMKEYQIFSSSSISEGSQGASEQLLVFKKAKLLFT